MGGFPGIGAGSGKKVSDLKLATDTVGIESYNIGTSSSTFKLKNNYYDTLTVTEFRVNQDSNLTCNSSNTNPALPIVLNVGQSIIITCSVVNTSTYTLSSKQTPMVGITYTDNMGATRSAGNEGSSVATSGSQGEVTPPETPPETPSYTITFDANGGTGSMSTQTIQQGASANLTANNFTRTNYTFNGWNTLANGSGSNYSDNVSYTMGSGNVTLYAKWTAAQVPITTYWTGAVNGNLNNAANWDNGVPTSGDTAVIEQKNLDLDGNLEMPTSGTCVAGTVSIEDIDYTGATLIFGGTFSGTVTNNGVITGGTFNGTVTNNFFISDGTFYGAVTNNNEIDGGNFCQTQAETGGTISGGTFSRGATDPLCYNYPLIVDACGTPGDATDPDCWSAGQGYMNWTAAGAACADLVDYDWRLPTITELEAGLTAQFITNPPTVTGFAVTGYWSSTEFGEGGAWLAYYGFGAIGSGYGSKDSGYSVRCIR
jgi:uncharacterized repeat protein (TIGR02543 family)